MTASQSHTKQVSDGETHANGIVAIDWSNRRRIRVDRPRTSVVAPRNEAELRERKVIHSASAYPRSQAREEVNTVALLWLVSVDRRM